MIYLFIYDQLSFTQRVEAVLQSIKITTLHPAHRTFKKREEGKAWIVCMVSVICTCLFVHTSSRDENCNCSSTIGTLCYGLWYTVLFLINILYIEPRSSFLYRYLFFSPNNLPATFGGTGRTVGRSLSQQVCSPADLLSRDKTSQVCAYLRGFNSQTRTHARTHTRSGSHWSCLAPLEMCDNPENRNQTNGTTWGSSGRRY